MMSGLHWVGLGGSAAAVGVNYLRWDVCTLERGIHGTCIRGIHGTCILRIPFYGIMLFYEGVFILISLFSCVCKFLTHYDCFRYPQSSMLLV